MSSCTECHGTGVVHQTETTGIPGKSAGNDTDRELDELIRRELTTLTRRVLNNLQPGSYSEKLVDRLNELVDEGSYALPRAIQAYTDREITKELQALAGSTNWRQLLEDRLAHYKGKEGNNG